MTIERSRTVRTGGCLCGAVRYESHEAPVAELICHCRDCQRASGTDGVPIMVVPRVGFHVTGETRRFAVPGSSGRDAIRNFCARCGSLLFGTPDVAPHIVTIYVGSLDDPTPFAPRYAQFTRSKPAWSGARVAAYETMPPMR